MTFDDFCVRGYSHKSLKVEREWAEVVTLRKSTSHEV